MPQTPTSFEEVKALSEKIKESNTNYKKSQAAFISQFPDWMRNILLHLGIGQTITEQEYKNYECCHGGDSLTKGQHPRNAVISSSNFTGHCYNIIGLPDNDVAAGSVLTLRVPGGVILNSDDEPSFEARAFLALAGLKHLDTVFHAKSSGSQLLHYAYLYYKNGRDFSVLPEEIRNDRNIRRFIKSRWAAYWAVEESLKRSPNFKEYEDRLLFDPGSKGNDKDQRDKFTDGLDYDERFVRAMAMQMLLWSQEAILADEHSPKNAVAVLQGVASEREFVWSEKLDCFVAIPDDEEDSPHFNRRKEVFFEALPEGLTTLQNGFPCAAALLMRGAREFKKTLAMARYAKELGLEPPAVIVSCSDSRAASATTLGSPYRLRYVLRNPGAFISSNGKVTPSAGRYMALAQEEGLPVVFSYHGNCGAMEAIDACLLRGIDVPGPFRAMAQERKALLESVFANSGTTRDQEEKAIAFYKGKYGVNIRSIPDCMALQQAMDDYKVVQTEYPGVKPIVAFQNMPETQNYVLNPNTMKFVPIPAALWGLKETPERKVKPRVEVAACGCGCEG